MNFTVSLTGAKDIDNLLQQMPKALTHKVLSDAHVKAAKPLVEKEKLLAPEGPTGHLVDSIGAVRSSFKRANTVGEVKVGPRRGRFKGNHGHLVEFGTRKRQTEGGANRGIMPKKPFAEPAFNTTKGQIEGSIARSIGQVMVRTMKRYAKR
jgi:HK97 gp10 family phage protein